MKALSLHVEQAHQLGPALTALGAFDPDLVLAFGARRHFEPDAAALRVQPALPRALVIGCSGAGEIAGGMVHDGGLSLTALRFDAAHVSLAATDLADMNDSQAAGERLGHQFAGDDLRHVLLLAPGLDINGSALIAGVRNVHPDVGLSGGLAGDDGRFECTYTLAGDRAHPRQVVAVGLHGPALHVGSAAVGGWEPFGPARRVSRSEANVLHELDGERALDVYRRYLGSYADALPASGLLFPFEILDAGHRPTGLIRTILGIDVESGSLTLAGDVPPDGFVRLMHASTDRLIDAAEAAATRIVPQPGHGDAIALLVSCVGRRLVMGDRVDEEVEAVAARLGTTATLCGFYSYGEIATSQFMGDCRLHNQTMTVTWLAET